MTVYSEASDYSAADVSREPYRVHFMPMRYSFQFQHLRKQAGLTQQQLAEKIGVEQPTVQRWEKGKQKPSLDDLDRLAAALGVHPGELFHDDELAADPASTEAALRELAAAALRSAGGNVPASSVRPIVHGLQRGLALLLRNPAIRSNADALAVAVHAIESPAPETTMPS